MSFTLKPILARNALTSTYGKNIAINPYQGCVFACEFCSAIKMNFFTGRTKEAVECFYSSLEPNAKRERWEKRQRKISDGKEKAIKSKRKFDENQPALFDIL